MGETAERRERPRALPDLVVAIAPVLAGLAAMALLHGTPAGWSNEAVYLLELAATRGAGAVPGDWSLAGPHLEHLVFNRVFGALSALLSLEALAWLGRIGCWTWCLVGWLRIGDRLGVGRWWTSGCIVGWVAYGATSPNEAWMFGGFEAKCLAWGSVLFAIDARLCGRATLSALWLGASIAWHPGVGAWAALGLGLTELCLRTPIARLVRTVVWTSLVAAPGLVPLLLHPPAGASAETHELIVRLQQPFHLDPAYWGRNVALPFLAWGAAGIAWWAARRVRPLEVDAARGEARRWLYLWLSWLGVFFAIGIGLRAAGAHAWLLTIPFRLFGLLAPPIAGLLLASLALELCDSTPRRRALVVAFASFLLGIAGTKGASRVERVRASHAAPERALAPCEGDEGAGVHAWLRRSTDESATIVAPPWHRDALFRSRRGQVAVWGYLRIDALEQWRARIEALVGPLAVDRRPDGANAMEPALWMRERYARLTVDELAEIRRRFGGDYHVGWRELELPVAHVAGRCRVHDLRSLGEAPDAT